MKLIALTFHGGADKAAEKSGSHQDQGMESAEVLARPSALLANHLKELAWQIACSNPEMEGRIVEVALEYFDRNGYRFPVLRATNGKKDIALKIVLPESFDVGPLLKVACKKNQTLLEGSIHYTMNVVETS